MQTDLRLDIGYAVGQAQDAHIHACKIMSMPQR